MWYGSWQGQVVVVVVVVFSGFTHTHTHTHTRYWWGNLRERGHLGDTGVDERIILRWIFRKWDVGV